MIKSKKPVNGRIHTPEKNGESRYRGFPFDFIERKYDKLMKVREMLKGEKTNHANKKNRPRHNGWQDGFLF